MDKLQDNSTSSFVRPDIPMPTTTKKFALNEKAQSIVPEVELKVIYHPTPKSENLFSLIKTMSMHILHRIKSGIQTWFQAKANLYAQSLFMEFQPVKNKIGCSAELRATKRK